MRPLRTNVSFRFSKGMRELARRIAEADNVVPLQPGELRPPEYYRVAYFARGRKPLPPPKPIPTQDDAS
jgi:hypothetical protein